MDELSRPGSPKRWSNSAAEIPETFGTNTDTGAVISEDPVLNLRLIATSDLHASLLPYDYCANRPAAGRGLGEVARQIEIARAEVPNTLLFDNGDFLQGNPLADFVASIERRKRTHPVITAFNALGYDAVTLGNHDFDYGLDFLGKAIAHARFPVVSANIATALGQTPVQDQTLYPPFTLLQRQLVDSRGKRHSLGIGVIGFAPPRIESWGQGRFGDRIRARGILAAAQAWLPKLKAAGADVIVALVHSGIGPIDADDGMENAATALAALPEVDAVIAGHSHLTFPGPGLPVMSGVDPVRGCLAGKPAVMPGHSGSHLGIIDLCLSRSKTPGRWSIIESRARLSSLNRTRTQISIGFQKAIAPDHRATLAWSRRSLGQTSVPLTTFFATSAPTMAATLIAMAKVDHARRALAGTALGGLPVLAAVTPFRAGGLGGPDNFTNIPAGIVRMRNLWDIYPFSNSLVTLALTAADVTQWLELSASIFNQISPGARDAPLHDPTFPAFAFDCIPGLDYAIDLSQPPRYDAKAGLVNPGSRRIVGLSLDGRPLQPDEPLLLVTSSHRAGRLDLNGDKGPRVVLADGVRVQAVVAEYLRAKEIFDAPQRRNWHFLPMPGTSLCILTGSGAEEHLADIGHMRPEFLCRDAEGFLHYRLQL